MREAGKKKMETQLPHLWNPHKIKKKSDKMKLRYKISIWVALALAGSLLWGGSVWLWLAGICATPNHWIGGLLFSVIALVFLMPVLMSYGKKPVRDKLNR